MASLVLRNNAGLDITDKALRSEFPAIFNQRRSTSVSEEYQMYRSDQVIDLMQNAGLRLVEVSQERASWSKKRHPHTQVHIMRFMSPQIALRDFGVGDSRPEIVVKNSHDGRSTFQALAGVFRLVCSNGMIVGDEQYGKVIRRHYGEANAFEKVKEIISDLPRVVETVSQRIADWSALDLTPKDQLALAKMLMEARKTPEWLLPEQVLEARRDGERVGSDGRRDLWTTFNVLQESLTNAKVAKLAGEGRGRSILPITASFSNVRVNQALWTKAEDYFNGKVAKLKGDDKAAFEELRVKRNNLKPIKAKELVAA